MPYIEFARGLPNPSKYATLVRYARTRPASRRWPWAARHSSLRARRYVQLSAFRRVLGKWLSGASSYRKVAGIHETPRLRRRWRSHQRLRRPRHLLQDGDSNDEYEEAQKRLQSSAQLPLAARAETIGCGVHLC